MPCRICTPSGSTSPNNRKASISLIDSIDDAATVYAANPEMGTSRLELSASLRCFVVDRYVAFYVPTPAGIEVIQIIHGSRDIPVHFRRSPK